MHRKLAIVTIFACLLIFAGCNKPKDLRMLFDPTYGIKTGVWQMALIVEATTNFSSLLYDKTEAKIERFVVQPITMVPNGVNLYIVPSIYTDEYGKKIYDETYKDVVSSYIRLNNYGKVVNSLDQAEFVIVVGVDESVEMYFGENNSEIVITVQDLDENILFYSNVYVTSKSDKNFYYRPSKGARAVKYLSLKGLEKIFKDGLPNAFS